mmetsp:Transcript_5024/g.3461  ORF Transcript_5024/g.3461 Transcript_5024/m.3461 type:complete len:95 (+) Transcript_5024:543-827(+)
MLTRFQDNEKAKNIRRAYKDIKTPLMNFMDVLFEALDTEDFELLEVVLPYYQKSLDRDSSFMTMLNTVCAKKFNGQSFKKENPMQAMLKSFLGN